MTKHLLFALVLLISACRRAYQVGDHVLVEWRGSEYPAVVVGVEGPAKFHVHYDGFSDDWDEVIAGARIRARLSTAPSPLGASPDPSRRINPTPSSSATPRPPSVYHVGDRVRVEWHGSIYTATVVTVLGDDRYRVHYEGYGNEWDEDIALSRIHRKN